ncbi:MAG: hypothetical protein S4CHLAM37_04380 [Chlamydiia bacterium]|nr:hypothetical protein [Chlamydiia bacterium]
MKHSLLSKLVLVLLAFPNIFQASEVFLNNQKSFKLYCMYTPSFKRLYEESFKPSIKDNFEIIAKVYPDHCPSGEIHAKGWEKVMLNKLELLEQAVRENWNNQVFFFSDIDIIFFDSIIPKALQCLGERDFVAQQGFVTQKSAAYKICAGFFVMRGNLKTLKLIRTAYDLLEKGICIDDQVAIRKALKILKLEKIDWGLLPLEEFANGRIVLRKNQKNPNSLYLYHADSKIELPDSIVMFHATFCKGLDLKLDFLKRVQEEYVRVKKNPLEI